VPGERVRTSNERWIVLHRAIVTDGVGIDRAVAGNVRTVHTTEVRMTKPRLRLNVGDHRGGPSARARPLLRTAVGLAGGGQDPTRPSEPPDDGWLSFRPPPRAGPTLNFEYERLYVPPIAERRG